MITWVGDILHHQNAPEARQPEHCRQQCKMAKTPCSKHQGRGKTPKICTLEFSGLMFGMGKISLPLHSQQTLLTIRSISNNLISQTPQSASWHSRISSRCSVALSGYVPAQSVLCRTGQKKHVCSLMHVQHYSIGSV